MKTAYGYHRVSSKRQATEGHSLAAQEKAFRAWCRGNKYEPVVFVEAASAKATNERPVLAKAVAEACAAGEGAAFVVSSLSRFARSLSHALATKDKLVGAGVRFVSMKENADTDTTVGRLAFNLLSSIYEFEREINSERVAGIVEHKRANGERLGTLPYGFSDESGKLVKDDTEQKALRRMKRWRRDGESFRGVARRLDESGVPTRRGGAWTDGSVRSVLGLLKRKAG